MPHIPLPLNRLYLSHSVSEPSFGETPDVFYYVKLADGKRSIVRQSALTGMAQTITAEPMPAGGVGYGGGVYAVRGDTLVYAAKDERLHGFNVKSSEQWAITPAYEGVAAPALSPCGEFVAFLAEQDGKCNVLLADVRGRSLPVKLSHDPWYAFNPAFSADGARLAWQEWNELDMPWDESRLVIARFARATGDCAASTELLPVKAITRGKPRVSYASPQFSPDGKNLAFTSDESGWRSLWVARLRSDDATGDDLLGSTLRVDTGEGEIGGPDWVPGLIKMRWSGDRQATRIYAVRRHHGHDTLLRVTWPEIAVTEIKTTWTMIANLNVHRESDQLILIGANPTTPETLVTLDPQTGQETPRATSAVGLLDTASLVQPEVISWKTAGDAPIWGILYKATGPEAGNGPRPLIVLVHGGPTSERPLAWYADAQYFATRGWHCLIVNHRGGTGYGRGFQDMLNGQWGVVDVEDARTGAEHLINAGLADPQRLVIMGGSAGGYTTLMALARDPDFWAAGVSFFGVGDLYELKQGSHRFEVNYEQTLIGRLPQSGPLWKERSPLTHVKNVRAPVLLFHGKDDKAVPHQQSVDFAEAVKRSGGIAELTSYEGEGHGFVKEATRRDVMEKTERFLDKYVICLQK